MSESSHHLTIADLHALKQVGEKICCLTAYDASFSALIDKAGIEVILVGDSLGMVMQGHDSTLAVTINDMIYHTRCVSFARKRSFVMADLPFMTYATPLIAAENAARLLREAGAQMVKLEGAHYDVVSFLVAQGIPVCGHLGLLPQSINIIGGYRVQGKGAADATLMLEQALQLQEAGISLLVLECVPAGLAKRISEQLSVPVIGIGAGRDCDGQVLVLQDMLNISAGQRPRFVKNFMQGAEGIAGALQSYKQAVKRGEFPAAEHSY